LCRTHACDERRKLWAKDTLRDKNEFYADGAEFLQQFLTQSRNAEEEEREAASFIDARLIVLLGLY